MFGVIQKISTHSISVGATHELPPIRLYIKLVFRDFLDNLVTKVDGGQHCAEKDGNGDQ